MEQLLLGSIIFIFLLSLISSVINVLYPNYKVKKAIREGSPILSDSIVRVLGLVWLGIILTLTVYFITSGV